MRIKVSILLILFFLPQWLYGEIKGESLWTKTEDGRDIHIFFLRAKNEPKANYPIILCHGLGAQGKYWYFNENASWALEFSKNGFDVFVPDLRGVGKSSKGGMKFSFYDYQKDVEAIIDKVKKITGAEKVHWIGHSMGGMVMYLTLTERSHIAESIASFTFISSPYTIWQPFEVSKLMRKNFDEISEAMKKVDAIPFSLFAGFYRFLFPFFRALEDISPIARSFQYFIWNVDIVEPEIRKDAALGTGNVSSQVLEKFFRVGLGFEDFGFDIQNMKAPALFLVGSKDFLATPPTVKLAYIKAGAENKSFVLASVGEGFSADYGHVDITITIRSKQEIFPIVLAHVIKNDQGESGKENEKEKQEQKIQEQEKTEQEEEKTENDKKLKVIVSKKRQSKYSFLLLQDFGLKSDVWKDLTKLLDEKYISYIVPEEVISIDGIVRTLEFFCKEGTSSYNIGVFHGFAGTAILKIKEPKCLDAIFLIASPIKNISRYYELYLENGGKISKTIINQIFGGNVQTVNFSPLDDMIQDILSADFLVRDKQKIFFVLSTGTRTQYWWDIGEIPKYLVGYSTLLVSYVNFMEDASHIELIKGKKAKRYVFPYIMHQIASLKK